MSLYNFILEVAMSKDFLIPYVDYGRIFRVIYSAIKGIDATPHQRCYLFAFYSENILRKHYHIDAVVKAGLAGFKLSDDNISVMVFGSVEGKKIVIDEDNGFHAWIEANGWIIDFYSPLFFYPEGPRKMFQKKLIERKESLDDLKNMGDFFISEYVELSAKLLENMKKFPAMIDLIDVTNKWYCRPPRTLKKFVNVGNELGKDVFKISLDAPFLDGYY